jgi:hypothetical protein
LIPGQVARVGLFGTPLKQFKRRAIGLDPRPQQRVRLRPGERRNGHPHRSRQHGPRRSEHPVRSPKKCEGIPILGNAHGAERRNIERVADVRQPVQTPQPPDGEGRGSDHEAERQDDRDP